MVILSQYTNYHHCTSKYLKQMEPRVLSSWKDRELNLQATVSESISTHFNVSYFSILRDYHTPIRDISNCKYVPRSIREDMEGGTSADGL